MTEHPGDRNRREETRERREGPGRDHSEPSDREIEERLVETERRKEQLQEAWRRRRTAADPGKKHPNDERGGRKRSP